MTEKEKKLILLSDFIETKVRKVFVFDYFHVVVEYLLNVCLFLKKEIDLTNLIIDMVNNNTIIDIREQLLEKQQQNLLGSSDDDKTKT